MSKKNRCLNCGALYNSEYAYCPYCGQANRPNRLNLKFVISEFLSANFNLDSKFFTTLRLLLFSPAFLTRVYLEGKRTLYTSPVRIYLIISIIYFSLLSIFSNVSVEQTNPPNVSISTEKTSSTVQLESNQQKKLSPLELKIFKNKERFKTVEGRKIFWQNVRKYFSIGMWLLMPLTAFILYLLFYKNTYYFEHLVFIIHLQSVWFIISAVYMVLQHFLVWKMLILFEILLLLWVTFLWFKRFYKKNTVKIIWKMSLFFGVFGFLIFLFFVVILLINLLF